MDDEDFSEDLAALGGPRGVSGARHDRDQRTHKRRRKRGLEAEAEEFSAFAAHSWASGTRDWN
jgi:hypothetical protein